MIRLVIFDLTNVCFTDEETLFLAQFAKKHHLNPTLLAARHNELVRRAEVGELDGFELWQGLLDEFALKEDPTEIVPEMISLKREVPEMIDLVRSLKGRVRVAFLTNYNKVYWAEIVRQLNPLQHFDFGIVSYEIGARKPDVRAFEAIVQRAGVLPNEVVFLDDSAGNLVHARELGIHTIHFKNRQLLEAQLRALGVGGKRT